MQLKIINQVSKLSFGSIWKPACAKFINYAVKANKNYGK